MKTSHPFISACDCMVLIITSISSINCTTIIRNSHHSPFVRKTNEPNMHVDLFVCLLSKLHFKDFYLNFKMNVYFMLEFLLYYKIIINKKKNHIIHVIIYITQPVFNIKYFFIMINYFLHHLTRTLTQAS